MRLYSFYCHVRDNILQGKSTRACLLIWLFSPLLTVIYYRLQYDELVCLNVDKVYSLTVFARHYFPGKITTQSGKDCVVTGVIDRY